MNAEPRADHPEDGKLWTTAEVLARLSVLENKMENEGRYVSATTCFLARMTIRSMSEAAAEREDDFDERRRTILQDDDGQPDEAQEWHDYDPDC